jgi:hypothetical protein
MQLVTSLHPRTLAAALLVALPVFCPQFPGVLLAASDGDRQVTYFALSGPVLPAEIGLGGPRPAIAAGSGWLAGVCVGATTVVVVYLLLNPIAVAVRGVGLTPERAVIALATAIFLLPLALSFHVLSRRGGPVRRTLLALAGRGVTLGALALAVALRVRERITSHFRAQIWIQFGRSD